jgi:hypothetical protein
VFAADAGKEIDRLAAQARDGTHKVDQKLEAYRQRADQSIDQTIKKTGTELNKAVDSFDKNVGEVSLATSLCMAHSLITIRRVPRRPRMESLAGSALASRVGIGRRRTSRGIGTNGCNDMATNNIDYLTSIHWPHLMINACA